MREGIRILAREQRAGHDIHLGINLSGRSICDPEMPDILAHELQSAGADGHGLWLEVTETAAIVNVDRARRFAAHAHEQGCEMALDDFGAGFASFYYLKHLDFDYLKIDGEFIRDLTANRTNELVVQSIVAIARGLGKRTIAEFVGDEQALELLTGHHVDYAQGFYLAKPAPVAELDLGRPSH